MALFDSDFGSRGVMAAVLFTLTLFRQGELFTGRHIAKTPRRAIASPRCRHRRAIRYDSDTERHSWRTTITDPEYRHRALSTDRP